MEKMYKRLLIGVGIAFSVLLIFLTFETFFMDVFKKEKDASNSSINREDLRIIRNEAVKNLELRVDNMEKYIDSGQKNLDHWLKILTLVLSLLIGFSVYTGLKERDLAKEELGDIREIKRDIKNEAVDAKERLREVYREITEIKEANVAAREIKTAMTQSLDEIGSKKSLVLDASQKRIIDESIIKSKEDLQKTGIETLKNLYYAKALKAQNDKNWEDSIRLSTNYIDFDDNNQFQYSIRAFGYYSLNRISPKDDYYTKGLSDLNEVIRLHPSDSWAYNLKGTFCFEFKNDYENAILYYSKAIQLDPNLKKTYYNRSLAYRRKGMIDEAEKDLAKSK